MKLQIIFAVSGQEGEGAVAVACGWEEAKVQVDANADIGAAEPAGQMEVVPIPRLAAFPHMPTLASAKFPQHQR